MNKLLTLAAGLAFVAAGSAQAPAQSSFVHPDVSVKVAGAIITQSGGIAIGKGFTVTHNGTGSYTLTWPNGYFKSCPSVNVTPAGGNGDIPIANLASYGCGANVQVTVDIFSRTNGTPQDNAFHITLNVI